MYRWYYPLLVVVILAVGVMLSWYIYALADKSERNALTHQAAMLAETVTPTDIYSMSATEADIVNPRYIELKDILTRIRTANPNIRFVYIMGQRSNGVPFFYVDSESSSSDSYSYPGQNYDEASDELKNAFKTKVPGTEGPSRDRWGNWISAFAPIIDPETGNTAAIFGIDIAAEHYSRTITAYAIIPGLLTFFIVLLLIAGWRIRRKEQEIVNIKMRFISVASHEIRSPLTGLRWAIEQLKNEAPALSEGARRILQNAHSTSTNLILKINDLLDLESIEHRAIQASGFEQCNIVPMIRDTIEQLTLAAEERSIDVKIDETVPQEINVRCSTGKLSQVFSNLISNAIKYSKTGGIVRVSYEKDEHGRHVIAVKDSGIGIPTDEVDKVFKGFYRARNAEKQSVYGTGFGLHLAVKILELHGGSLRCESEEGKGTTMFVRLPAE